VVVLVMPVQQQRQQQRLGLVGWVAAAVTVLAQLQVLAALLSMSRHGWEATWRMLTQRMLTHHMLTQNMLTRQMLTHQLLMWL
jgi:hypothetical protein